MKLALIKQNCLNQRIHLLFTAKLTILQTPPVHCFEL